MRARLVVWALVLLAGCGGSTPAGGVSVIFTQGSSTLSIRAQVAATTAGRTRGLMGRRSLEQDSGMLFLYPTPVQIGFWMKDTLIPLDIAFISEGRVVEIRSMTPCRADPCPVTTPASSYGSALEVNAGAFARAGITNGAAVEFEGRLPTPF